LSWTLIRSCIDKRTQSDDDDEYDDAEDEEEDDDDDYSICNQ